MEMRVTQRASTEDEMSLLKPTRQAMLAALLICCLPLPQAPVAQEPSFTAAHFRSSGAQDRLENLRWKMGHIKTTLDLVSSGTDFLIYDYVSLRDGQNTFQLPIALPKEWVINQIKSLSYAGQLEPEAAAALSNFYAEETGKNYARLNARYQQLSAEVARLEKDLGNQSGLD